MCRVTCYYDNTKKISLLSKMSATLSTYPVYSPHRLQKRNDKILDNLEDDSGRTCISTDWYYVFNCRAADMRNYFPIK